MVTAIRTNGLGAAANGVESVRVTMHESHIAWAAFEGPLPALASIPAQHA
jgi:6-pyruvoyltetrahydropterin/6-carboxytetrahydropterin synthase